MEAVGRKPSGKLREPRYVEPDGLRRAASICGTGRLTPCRFDCINLRFLLLGWLEGDWQVGLPRLTMSVENRGMIKR